MFLNCVMLIWHQPSRREYPLATLMRETKTIMFTKNITEIHISKRKIKKC